jgi:uncharacterized protein YdgA (DUF945 family)
MEKRMKKISGLIVVILAVLILGGYYGMGIITEKTIKKNIEAINQSNGLAAELSDYKRGFFTSTAAIKWRLHVPEREVKDANGQTQVIAAQDYRMEMPVRIDHGPIIWTDHKLLFGIGYAKSVVPMPVEYQEQFDALFSKESQKPQLDLSIFVNYQNKSKINAVIPAFKLLGKDGNGQFQWNGMTSTTNLSSGAEKVGGGIVIDGFQFNKDNSSITLGRVTSDYDLHQTLAGLYLGNANFSLPSFVVAGKDQKVFEIGDFVLSSDSNISEGLFYSHFNASLKSVLANGKTYGPGDVEVSLKNLDADVLAQINQQVSAMQNGTDAERQKAMLALLPQLPKLLSKGAELAISRLSMQLPEGQIQGSLSLSLPKGDGVNPFELFQKVRGNAKLKVPSVVVKDLMQRSLVKQMEAQPQMQQDLAQQLASTPEQPDAQGNQPTLTPEQVAAAQTDKQIAAMEKTGLVTLQGSDYVVEVNLEQGKFTVNGKPFDPAMMRF